MTTYDIKIEDLPESFRDIADVIGLENALKLVRMCGGQSTYIPKMESCERSAKARRIYEEYKGSKSSMVFAELAVKYNYTESHVRRIIQEFNGMRGQRAVQLELF